MNLKIKSSRPALAIRNSSYGCPFPMLPSGTVALGCATLVSTVSVLPSNSLTSICRPDNQRAIRSRDNNIDITFSHILIHAVFPCFSVDFSVSFSRFLGWERAVVAIDQFFPVRMCYIIQWTGFSNVSWSLLMWRHSNLCMLFVVFDDISWSPDFRILKSITEFLDHLIKLAICIR